MTQEELAEAAGVRRNTISAYEIGGKSPSLYTAVNIIDALNWSLNDWVGDWKRIEHEQSWRRAGRRGKQEKADDYNT